MSDPSAGEVGGIFAGGVALLIAIGHGLRWLLGWGEQRDRTRREKLDTWQRELDAREAKIDAEMAAQHEQTQQQYRELKDRDEQREREHAALHTAYKLITAALRNIDPGNAALRMADEMLRIAFPPDPILPPDIERLVNRIDHSEKGIRP